MSGKLLWVGLTIFLAASVWTPVPAMNVVGVIIMIIGAVLLVLDK